MVSDWVVPSKTKPSNYVETSPSDSLSNEIFSKLMSNVHIAKANYNIYTIILIFLKSEFVFAGAVEAPMPQYVICFEILSKKCMKLFKLETHNLPSKQPECVGIYLDFFKSSKEIF